MGRKTLPGLTIKTVRLTRKAYLMLRDVCEAERLPIQEVVSELVYTGLGRRYVEALKKLQAERANVGLE